MMKRIMDYINSGKQQGARVHLGGERHGKEGYWVQPTIFTDTRPDMRIVKEEIFGPVGVVIKFEDEEDVLRQANDTMYGLAAAVFTKDITRGIKFAHKLHAGTVWVNCINSFHPNVPFGGYKQSGVGRELGEYALTKCVLVLSYLVRGRLIPCTFSLTPATPTSKRFTSTSANVSERRNRGKGGGNSTRINRKHALVCQMAAMAGAESVLPAYDCKIVKLPFALSLAKTTNERHLTLPH
jgi:delta 1-pyrroline-5-carboxylate dehydrogenase